jgi:hypothetical protein
MHESTFQEHGIASKSSQEEDMLDFETLSILHVTPQNFEFWNVTKIH